MPSFPLIKELPEVIESGDLAWEPFKPPDGHHSGFWLGTDRQGRKWLTKLRGPRYAYREIAFGRIAQEMGWYCQSSAYLRLSTAHAKLMGDTEHKVHAVHYYMEEHAISQPCAARCRFEALLGKHVGSVEDLNDIAIDHILDWPRAEFAACLFGANDGPDRLITAAHEFVIIDSEQMFSTGPSSFAKTRWWGTAGGRDLAKQMCRGVGSLSPDQFDFALRRPSAVRLPSVAKFSACARESYRRSRDPALLQV
jgi:hypothetical protein